MSPIFSNCVIGLSHTTNDIIQHESIYKLEVPLHWEKNAIESKACISRIQINML